MNYLTKQEDGYTYFEDTFDRSISIRLLKRQPVNRYVQVGMMVRYHNDLKEWISAAGNLPTGMYIGNKMIALQGRVTGLSNLVPGSFYWMRSDSFITNTSSQAYKGLKVGYAMSDTELLLDIDVTGDNTF